MKILLVNPPCRNPNMVPLGLGYIASILRNQGHQVGILDINGYQYSIPEVEDKIKRLDYDCAGIGGLSSTYKYVKWLAETIKKHRPQAKVIAGNMVATAAPRLLLEKSRVDIAVIDEGERTCEELFSALSNKDELKTINGIWYKEDGKIYQNPLRNRIDDLDKLPFPAWDLFPMEVYLKNPIHIEFGARSINICAVRGCPYACSFCSRPFGRTVVARSAEHIAEEINELKKDYKVGYIAFSGDHFIVSRDWIFDLCAKLKKTKIKWGAAARVNLVDKEMLKAMKDAGCICLGYGFESGSQQILDNMNKRVTVEQAGQAIKLTRQAGIYVMSSFMFGMVGETKETIKASLDFIRMMRIPEERLLFTTPYPGTPLYELAKKMGRLPLDEDKYLESLGEMQHTCLVNFTDFSNEELIQLKNSSEASIRKNFDIFTRLERRLFGIRRRLSALILEYKVNGPGASLRRLCKSMVRI